jgi:hypothetical protein
MGYFCCVLPGLTLRIRGKARGCRAATGRFGRVHAGSFDQEYDRGTGRFSHPRKSIAVDEKLYD